MKIRKENSPPKHKQKESENHSELVEEFKSVLKEPEQFLSVQLEKYQKLSDLLQQVYQIALNSNEGNKKSIEVLPELVLESMHEEQIWQQLELMNNALAPVLEKSVSKISASGESFEIKWQEDNDDIGGGSEEEGFHMNSQIDDEEDMSANSSEQGYSGDETNISLKASKSRKKAMPSIVDDKFFKLDEMKAFLEAEEAKEMKKKSTSGDFGIDYFTDNFGDDENIEYKDFFENDSDEEDNDDGSKQDEISNEDNEERQENMDSDEEVSEDDNEEENHDNDIGEKDANARDSDLEEEYTSDESSEERADSQNKSSFEKRQERMEKRIKDYEEEVLGEKPWQLKGEIKATGRPQNSLLEEILEFDSTTRPAPIITEETTRRLEDIIRQRIKDKAWDDVELKVKPIHTTRDYRKQLVLDQEKSKQSLAQIYENEFQAELEKLDPNYADKEKEEPKEHAEIRNLMRSLFIKLDALTNFHFTPKPVIPEARIITNTPAVNMEEVAPVAVSDSHLLAPEEIFKRAKHLEIGKSERTKTDKNRERRKKKQKQRAIFKALKSKEILKEKMGLPKTASDHLRKVIKNRNVNKITASSDVGALKSSSAFFSKLQNTTTNKIRKSKPEPQSLEAKKLKL